MAGMRFTLTQRIRRVGLIGTFGLDENCAPQLEVGSSEIGMVDSALSIVASVRSAHGRFVSWPTIPTDLRDPS